MTSPLQLKPAIIVIFGITGDLAQRKLLPALYHLFKDKLLDERTVILGISRREITAKELLSQVELCVNEVDTICDPVALGKVQAALRMQQMSLVDGHEYDELLQLLNAIEAEKGVCLDRLYYLSIPPQMFEPIVKNLGSHGLNASCQHGAAASRSLVEKPFGYDLKSAEELILETGEWFSEAQIFRIDHYLAKQTVQNILAFRASTPILSELWDSRHISSITITSSEKISIEGRAVFYDSIGALRDFVQSHLLQMLAVVTMQLPSAINSPAVHTARLQLLDSIAAIKSDDVATQTLRGQYQGYTEEVQKTDSFTETYAEIRLSINQPSWKDVAITLRTGKAMAEKRTDIRIMLKDGPTLIFTVQPSQDIRLEAGSITSDVIEQLEQAVTDFNHEHPAKANEHPEAYERVIIDAITGDHTLFTSDQEVLAAWRVVDHVQKVWAESGDGLIIYPKGAASISLK